MAIKELIPWKKNNGDLAVRREPAHPFEQFRREMDQLFDGFLTDWPGRTSLLDRQLGSFMPDVEVKETEKEVRVTAELPGLDEKEVEVTLTKALSPSKARNAKSRTKTRATSSL
jgi:HSP20 family protein